MKTDETIKKLSDQVFLDKLYGYAYHRCRTSHEAEDLCSDIILAILRAIYNGKEIQNFYAFVWTVAHRVYADYCEQRKIHSDAVIDAEYSDHILNTPETPIDAYFEKEAEKELFSCIMRGNYVGKSLYSSTQCFVSQSGFSFIYQGLRRFTLFLVIFHYSISLFGLITNL